MVSWASQTGLLTADLNGKDLSLDRLMIAESSSESSQAEVQELTISGVQSLDDLPEALENPNIAWEKNTGEPAVFTSLRKKRDIIFWINSDHFGSFGGSSIKRLLLESCF